MNGRMSHGDSSDIQEPNGRWGDVIATRGGIYLKNLKRKSTTTVTLIQ